MGQRVPDLRQDFSGLKDARRGYPRMKMSNIESRQEIRLTCESCGKDRHVFRVGLVSNLLQQRGRGIGNNPDGGLQDQPEHRNGRGQFR